MNIKAKKIIAMLVTVVICFTLFSFSTAAVSPGKRGEIKLTALDKDTKEPLSGATFRLYRFASAYFKGTEVSFIYTDEFRNCGMEMGNSSDAYLPVHLMVHAMVNAVHFEEKTTGADGKIVFSNLQPGAYLIVPAGMKDGYLNPAPFIVTVPLKDETQNKWVYSIDATPKIEADKDDTDESKTYISVKKIWETYGKTPDSIKVSLIKDGAIVESVVLSAANNWYHRWDNLDKNHSWNVVETDVPDGYKVSYITSEMTVIITNTDSDYEDKTTTTPGDTTTTTEPSSSDDDTTTTTATTATTDTTDTTSPDGSTTSPTDTTEPDDTTNQTDTTKPVYTTKPTGEKESTTKPEELIDTGQLNWPVPVFSVAGLILFSIGWAMLNFGKKDEETA